MVIKTRAQSRVICTRSVAAVAAAASVLALGFYVATAVPATAGAPSSGCTASLSSQSIEGVSQ
jgi:hypothetical protein